MINNPPERQRALDFATELIQTHQKSDQSKYLFEPWSGFINQAWNILLKTFLITYSHIYLSCMIHHEFIFLYK